MVDNTVEFIFVFFFRLEDEEGEELVVSVADEEVSNKCISFDFQPLIFRESAHCYGAWNQLIYAMIPNH